MTVLSVGMALARHWFPVVMPARVSARGSLALEIRGTATIARATPDRIEVSIAARILLVAPVSNDPLREPFPAELRVEDRCQSAGALAEATPFLWLQLVDDRGVALSHETFIGRGVGIRHNVHARVRLATLMDSSDGPLRTRLSSGLNARIVARTYRNPSGPRYHVEVLVLTLLTVGSGFPAASELPSCCRDCHNELAGTVSDTGGYSPGHPLDARDGARPGPHTASEPRIAWPTSFGGLRSHPVDRTQRRFSRPESDPFALLRPDHAAQRPCTDAGAVRPLEKAGTS